MPFVRKADLERLMLAGDLLSNFAFNLKQQEGRTLNAHDCKVLCDDVERWDKAVRVVYKATKRAKEEPKQ